MSQFKIGDIVKLKDSDNNYNFYNILESSNFIIGDDKSGKILKCEILGSTRFDFFMESKMQKVTFYEMLDYIKDRYIRLTINKPNWNILNCLIDFTNGVTNGISYVYDSSDDSVTLYYYVNFFSSNLYVDFDNLDFEKDYVNKELNKCVDALKDTFANYLIYGKDTTKDEFLSKCCNSYIDLISNDNKKVEINMTRKEKELKDKIDTVNYWYTAVKEMLKSEPKKDEVFVNNKKKTTVIKWADGKLTKATCDKEDKYDLEKGVMVAMLKKYYTVDEINSFIEKAKESSKIDLNKTKNKLKKKQVK